VRGGWVDMDPRTCMWWIQVYMQCLASTTATMPVLRSTSAKYTLHTVPAHSTVYVLLLQVTMQSTAVLLLHAISYDSADSTHPAQPTCMHFMCFSTTIPVYVNHLHPVLSTFFFFMRQWFLWYIYSQHAASTVFYTYSKSNMLPSTSNTLLDALRHQVST
jgi:hypothetical protein